jgi:hypothetical protein
MCHPREVIAPDLLGRPAKLGPRPAPPLPVSLANTYARARGFIGGLCPAE